MVHTLTGFILIPLILALVFLISLTATKLILGRGCKEDIPLMIIGVILLFAAGGLYIYVENEPYRTRVMDNVG